MATAVPRIGGLRASLLVVAFVVLRCSPTGNGPTLASTTEALTFCPGPSVLQGIDVSEFQGSVDWNAVVASGRTFAMARVADGFYLDPDFAANWAGMRSAGLVRGVYQFFRPTEDAAGQADIVVSMVGTLGPGDLPPVLDLEETPGMALPSPATMVSQIQIWMDRVQAGTGTVPIIYAGSYFWDDYVNSTAFNSHPLWLASYGPVCPLLPAAWSSWTFHQYSSTGAVPGIAGNVDLDVFNGTLAQLQALSGGGPCTPHCDGTVVVGADCSRGDCAPFGSNCVDDSLGARCVFAFCPATGSTDVCWEGTHIGHCDNGALSSQGDCAVFAATCVDDSLGARCSSVFCPATGTSQVCVSPSLLATCTNGALGTPGNCNDFGSHCVSDSLGARCVFAFCPATGDASVCWENTHIGQCANGALTSQGDCGDFAAFCSTASASGAVPARCVSAFCVNTPTDAPVAHATCVPTATQIGQCDDNGVLTVTDCPAGQQCNAIGTPQCAAPVCPSTGNVDVCATDVILAQCAAGAVVGQTDCSRLGGLCSGVAGSAGCTGEVLPTDGGDVDSVELPDGVVTASVDASMMTDGSRRTDGGQSAIDGGGTGVVEGNCGCSTQGSAGRGSMVALAWVFAATMRRRRRRLLAV